MIKKPHVFGILLAIALFAVFVTAAKLDNQMGVLSKKSQAEKLWATSGHADSSGEAFRHWDEDGEIRSSCAKCHSTEGFEDFIADGSVDNAVVPTPENSVSCKVCHTTDEGGAGREHTEVTFSSGITIEEHTPGAICMECHQGRLSGPGVDDYIAGRAAEGDTEDTPNTSFGFRNIHYKPAAASQFGTDVKGGYEYSGKT